MRHLQKPLRLLIIAFVLTACLTSRLHADGKLLVFYDEVRPAVSLDAAGQWPVGNAPSAEARLHVAKTTEHGARSGDADIPVQAEEPVYEGQPAPVSEGRKDEKKKDGAVLYPCEEWRLTEKPDIPLPPPFVLPKKIFVQGRSRVVVAWNGREEILIVSADEKSILQQDCAMVSVYPLPTVPSEIFLARLDTFTAINDALRGKWQSSGGLEGNTVPVPGPRFPTSTSAGVFVITASSAEHIVRELNRYLTQLYGDEVAVRAANAELAVLTAYLDVGIRCFAFDLSLVSAKPATKAPICFRFPSASAFYPLVIGTLGGSGDTVIDLLVLSPGPLKRHESAPGDMRIVAEGAGRVEFSIDEVKRLAPAVATLFEKEGIKVVSARNLFIEGSIDGFQGDFKADAFKVVDGPDRLIERTREALR